MTRLLACAGVVLATTVWAQGASRSLSVAATASRDAYEQARRAPRCQQTIAPMLSSVGARIDALNRTATDPDITALKLELGTVAVRAPRAGCPLEVVDQLERAIDALEDARLSMWRDRRPGRGTTTNRRGDSGGRFVDNTPFVEMAPLEVQTDATWENEGAVRVGVAQLQLFNQQGLTFYIGARFRSLEGDWSEWVTTQTWSVPTSNFEWKNAFNHFFRFSTLAQADVSRGRFIAHVAVFAADGRTLAFREVPFRVRLGQQQPSPVPPPVAAPVPVVPARDCGTGDDPGCLLWRHGLSPMDAAVFQGFLQGQLATRNESLRLSSLKSVVARQVLTAEQMRRVMESFNNESLRLDAVRLIAPRLVNPQHALGFAATFRNSFFGQEYTKLLAREIGEVSPPPAQTQPVMPPAPPGPVPMPPGRMGRSVVLEAQAARPRDCGTGADDPGCGVARDGRWAMDAASYSGVLASLRGTANELSRAKMCETMVRSQAVTARQLEALLALFNNELTRLDVARAVAPFVVNPHHALGIAATFRNSFSAQEFTELMAAQSR
ncbi:MAG: DUF4476 domain-containing protein [Archangium sp.]|nr:DUF4476 domain-containing protein [Archangium sp.]